ncbi:MAG: M42 family metallopeptidase [Phycisphaeraceae bacterium]
MELLEKLTAVAGTPGREHRIRRFIRDYAEKAELFDEIRVDRLGSLIGIRKPRPAAGEPSGKPKKVMLAAHMDQIGFLVSHVDDRGFVRIQSTGGFDARNLFARICTICPDLDDPGKDIPGVLNPAGKPIHVATEEERKKVPDIQEFVVDVGLSGEEAKKRIQIGDMVVLRSEDLAEVGDTVVSQCLDNRIACWLLLRALEQLPSHECEIHAVFTVQEEVGLRGAGAAAFGTDPDVGIAVDTTLCIDTPGVGEELRVTEQGKGAALTVMDSGSIADLDLLREFEKIAEQKEIPHQRSILSRGGTDAAAMQRSRAGVPTFTLSCPTRYIHTVTEMIHRTDLFACRDLLAAYLEQA